MNRPAHRLPLAAATLLAAALWSHPAHACPYNVRDVGFVDLGDQAYQVRVYVDAATGEADVEQLRLAAAAALADVDAAATVKRVSRDAIAGQEPLRSLGIDALPAVVLESPDGRLLHVAPAKGEAERLAAAVAALEACAASPARDALTRRLVDAYAVVLLVDGDDAAANRAAEAAVRAALAAMTAKLPDLPKPVEEPPVLVRLGRSQRAQERVLLWCLGLEDETEPAAAVLYGKGRQLGPLLVGPALTSEALAARLELLGQSCECDLDRGFADGPRLPLRWNEEARRRAVQHLGFDPQSDATRSEIRRMLARGPGGRGDVPPEALPLDPLLGYSEFDVEPPVDVPEAEPQTRTAEQDAAPTRAAVSSAPANAPASARPESGGRGWWTLVALLTVAVAAGGALLLLKR